MKIFICCSKAFYDRISPIHKQLEAAGHIIELPNSYDNPLAEQQSKALGDESHSAFKKAMFERSLKVIGDSDAMLVLNFDKHGQPNYIGGATFLEVYDAYRMGKKIFFYNPLPEGILHDELSGMAPVVINGDLTRVA